MSAPLWNGNIGMMLTNLTPAKGATIDPNDKRGMLGMAYRYDQLNRLIRADGYTDYTYTTTDLDNNGSFGTGSAGLYKNTFEYDANGNILQQARHNQLRAFTDNIQYNYQLNDQGEIISNRLYMVDENDANSSTDYTDDIDEQIPYVDGQYINRDNNYVYTEIGELEQDKL